MHGVIGAEEAYENVRQLEWHGEVRRTCDGRENIVLETNKRTVTVRKWRTDVAGAGRYDGAMLCWPLNRKKFSPFFFFLNLGLLSRLIATRQVT